MSVIMVIMIIVTLRKSKLIDYSKEARIISFKINPMAEYVSK